MKSLFILVPIAQNVRSGFKSQDMLKGEKMYSLEKQASEM